MAQRPPKIPEMSAEAAKRVRNNGRQPTRTLQLDQIQIQVVADVYEGKKKVDKMTVGPEGGQPWTFFNLEDLKKWVEGFDDEMKRLNERLAEANAKVD